MGQVGRALACALAVTLATPAHAGPALASPSQAATSPTATSPTATSPTATSPAATSPAASSTSAPSPAEPTDQGEAIRRFRAAKELYGAGAYADAARGFESSYAAAPSPEAAYNAALAHDKTGADLATMTWFRRYLASASDSDPSYPQALQRVEELRARLGELDLQLDHPGEITTIRVNGEVVTLADFPRLVTPGRIAVQLSGATPQEVADIPVEIAAGGAWTIHFPGFIRVPQPVDPAPVTPVVTPGEPRPVAAPARRARPLAALFWTGTGFTAASAVAVGVLGGLTLRERARYAESGCGQRGDCPAIDEPFYRYRTTTNVMVGVTAGLAVITLALGIAALRERRKDRGEGPGGRLRVTLAGVQLTF